MSPIKDELYERVKTYALQILAPREAREYMTAGVILNQALHTASALKRDHKNLDRYSVAIGYIWGHAEGARILSEDRRLNVDLGDA